MSGGTLVIDNEEGSYTASTPMRVEITVPSLDEVTLSGSGAVSVSDVVARRADRQPVGQRRRDASGTADRVAVTVSGSGDAQLGAVVARDARAVVSGSGRIVLNATESLDASVPGSGAIVYSGEPEHVSSSITGVGVVTRG